ncbi:MAG: hypothetical protein IPK28_09085 [Devosia sp.]|nr:hypothetical protein [Devosia sp.]
MSHRYKVGQMLELRSSPTFSNRPAGPCEVLACLPHDSGPVLYRVQSVNERNERVVDEIDLTPSSATKYAQSKHQSVFSIAVNRR